MNEMMYSTVLKKSLLLVIKSWANSSRTCLENQRGAKAFIPLPYYAVKYPSWWGHQMETFSALLGFVRGIHRWPVNFPHKGQWCGSLMFSLICALNKRLSKQSWGWLFETPLHSLWRHCNDDSGWQAFENCKWPVWWYVIRMFCQTLTLLLVFIVIKVINPFSSWNVFLAVTKQL